MYSIINLSTQMPSYIYRLTVHNGDIYAYSSLPLSPNMLSHLSYMLRRMGIFHCWVVYNPTGSTKPITVQPGDLPNCDDACPISEDKITKPTAVPDAKPDITVVPPAAQNPAIVPVSPIPAEVPTPIQTPDEKTITPTDPNAIPTPSEFEEAARSQNLSLFGRKILPVIKAGNFVGTKQMVMDEFKLRLSKLQTDLARLDSRKKEVIQNSSAADEIDADMIKLNGLVSNAAAVLQRTFKERKDTIAKDLARMATDKSFQGLSLRDAAFIAARMEELIYNPIAETKKFLKDKRIEINKEMSA